MKKLRLGLVGCGGMGKGSHSTSLKSLNGKICDVSATCDIIPERAEQAAKNIGAPFYTTDYRELPEHVDAVLIALPHELHFEAGMYFIAHHKHVLMEKPLCVSEDECLKLIEAAEKENITLMCAYPVPYWPAIQMMKKLVDEKTYGDVVQMSIWTEQYTRPESEWGNTAKGLGGGQLFSHGCHYIDLLLWFLGNPVSGVHVGNRIGTPWLEKEGTSNVIMTFESGAMAYHFGTWGARGTRHGYSFQIHLTDGFLEYNLQERKLYYMKHYGTENPEDKVWDFTESEEDSHLTHHEIRHFIDCVINNKEPLTNPRRALQGLRVIWKLYEAEEQNKIADLRGLGLGV